MAKTMKVTNIKSLSAAGSKIDPKVVFFLSRRAKAPSTTSVRPVKTNTNKAIR